MNFKTILNKPLVYQKNHKREIHGDKIIYQTALYLYYPEIWIPNPQNVNTKILVKQNRTTVFLKIIIDSLNIKNLTNLQI